jgi:hypothetical protein
MLPPGVHVAWFDAYTFHTSLPGWAQRDFRRDFATPVPHAEPPARRRRVTAQAKAAAKAAAKAKAAPRSTDTRPLMTEQWCADNVEEFNHVIADHDYACQICFREPVLLVGPIHNFCTNWIPTRCTHMACCPCWAGVAARDRKCPFCRDDVSEWLVKLAGPAGESYRTRFATLL